jgi:hypothetical protein
VQVDDDNSVIRDRVCFDYIRSSKRTFSPLNFILLEECFFIMLVAAGLRGVKTHDDNNILVTITERSVKCVGH